MSSRPKSLSICVFAVALLALGRVPSALFAAPLFQAPANDNFANALTIFSFPYGDTQSTGSATTQANDPTYPCTGGQHYHSVWYAYTPVADGTLHVDTIGSNYDTVLAVWTGAWGSLTNVGCHDDISWPGNPQSTMDVAVTNGTTYYIEVAGYFSSSSGSLVLSGDLVSPPANDDIDNAFVISSSPYTYSQNTTQATTAADDPTFQSCGSATGHVHSHSVWYRFTPYVNGDLHVDTSGSDYDTVMAVWTGTRGSLTHVACHDDVSWPSDPTSSIDISVTAGTTYYIEVVSYQSGSGGNLEFNASYTVVPYVKMEVGTVSGVDENWVTVNLTNTYSSMVVIATPNYANNTVPIVSRVRNASGSSFQVRIQNPHATDPDVNLSGETVHYLAIEAGAYALPDGTLIEAQVYDSTVTDRRGSWNGEAQTYLQSYTNPVVVGQVMTYNDSDWSVFWDQSTGGRQNPPDASGLRTGKTVCRDSDTTRSDETIGFVVVEQGNGMINGIAYEAQLGGDSVRGVLNSPPYNYTFNQPFASTPRVALISQAAMDDNNGGWAILYGSTPLSANQISLAIDEDQIGNDRRHNAEQVAYLVFGEPVVIEPYDLSIVKSDDPDPVVAGMTLTYTLFYTITGPALASGVVITDTLPAGAAFGGVVSASPSLSLMGTSPPAWYTPTLAAGTQGTIVFTASVDAGASGVMTNTATITSGMAEDVLSNNVDTETTNVSPSSSSSVQFSSASYSVGENAGSAVITATLSAASGSAITVDYATSDGTAIAGSDYTAVTGTLSFPPSVTVQTFTVPITDDLLYDPEETVTLTLSNPSNATLGPPSTATLTIIDDDWPVYQIEASVAGAKVIVRVRLVNGYPEILSWRVVP
jgi:uncharacterized repeat protein (TIGR01451 family)